MSKKEMSLEQKAKELKKWQAIQNKPKATNFFWIMIVVLAVVYIVDEISTNICGTLQTNIIIDLFNVTSKDITSDEYTYGANALGIMSVIPLVFSLIAPFYKSLADKYGRKLFLIINTMGMALGMFIVMISPNPLTYMIGLTVINFVVPNDVQVLYITESVPAKDRAKYCNITKAFAILGISLIGILRFIFLDDDVVTSWRNVFIIPVILGIAAAVFGVVMLTETPAFLEKRIAYLSASEEELKKKEETEQIKRSAESGGVGNAIRFIFKHKQLRFIAICCVLYSFTSVTTSYYNSVMVGGGMTESQISTAIVVYPIIYAAITAISGFFSDNRGRKATVLTFGTVSMVCLICFVLSTKFIFNGVIVGILYGGYVGGLWSAGDTLLMTLPQESSPTNMRASIVGVITLSLLAGTIGIFGIVILYNFFRDYGWLCFAFSVPFMALSLIILKTKVHETKGIDLDTVTGAEWD